MGIAGGIIQIIVLLLPVILAALAAKNTPQAKEQTENERLDKTVADDDVAAINVFVHDKLHNEGSGNPSGQNDTIRLNESSIPSPQSSNVGYIAPTK